MENLDPTYFTYFADNIPFREVFTNQQREFQRDLLEVIQGIQQMLVRKNRKYGDSALNPNQTFSSVPPIELINVRIDDKLSRIRNRQDDEDEDLEIDLIGYLLLKQIFKLRESRKSA